MNNKGQDQIEIVEPLISCIHSSINNSFDDFEVEMSVKFPKNYPLEKKNSKSKSVKKKEEQNGFKVKKVKIAIGTVLFLIIGLIVLIGLYFYFKEKKKENLKGEKYAKEDLIIDIKYKPNAIYRYSLQKTTQMKVKSNSVSQNNSSKIVEQLSDFIFLIKQENIEKNEKNLTQKKWFNGYLAISNLSIYYENNASQIAYSNNIYNLLNKTNVSLDLNEENFFVKIDFYENGDIKDIFYPKKNFSISNLEYLKEYSKFIIPKISSNLYSKSINESLNALIQKNKKSFRNMKEDYEKKENIQNKKEYHKYIFNTSSKESQEFDIEEYLSSPSDILSNYNVREITNSSNITNLIEFSTENIESKEVYLENSILNKTINTSINKEGLLESVTEIENAMILNEKSDEDDISKILIFNNKSNITFDIDRMFFETINKLKLIDYCTDEKIIKNLFNYFDNNIYELFNETYYNEYISLLVKEKVIKENNLTNESFIFEKRNENINKLRKALSLSNTYYGMNRVTNEKDLYNYNLLGLKIQKKLYNELDPSNGQISSYSIISFGNINMKIKAPEQRSNLHIILEKKNKMAFNLIQLLYKSNLDLKQRNKNISEIIINLENNILELVKDYDYSNLFNECLEKINNQLNIFTGELFDKLITLINALYENYTRILEEVKNGEYGVFGIILTVTKNEYINYIYEMSDNLENFTNTTSKFLEKIEDEINMLIKIEKIDFLYDILDNIYESNLLIRQFNNYLFKAIEKGIIAFQIDINEFKETIIGDLLYITDFLSINIIKNPIITRAYDDKTLENISQKLKNFRNIIQSILDLLIKNINLDYEYEISSNNNSLKKYSELKAQFLYNKIENKSNYVINKIKEKIKYNDIYEIYTSNLDYIDYINNKTIIEFINDINNNILKKITDINPEYLNENNYKNWRNINKEISEISYSDGNDNIIYFDNETNFVFNELKEIFNYSIELNKKRIDDNYKLGIEYLNELNTIINKNDNYNIYVGDGFYKKYKRFLSKFNTFISLANSEELYDKLDANYLNIKKYTLKYIKDTYSSQKGKILTLSLISEQLNKYFDNKFIFMKNELFKFHLNELEKFNERKNNTFIKKFEYILNKSKGIDSTESDYSYNYKDIISIKKTDNWLNSTNNIEMVNLDVSSIIKVINNMTYASFEKYQKKLLDNIPNYINYIQILNNIYYKKDRLFDITKSITNEINKEINDINNFVIKYTNEYKKYNLYNMDYYLYKLNNLFLDSESNCLFNELRAVFNYTIELHKKRIDDNYKLAIEYISQVKGAVLGHQGDHIDIGTGAVKKYIKFREMFEEYIYLANSEEIYDNLKHNYIKIKNEVFDFVKKKITNITEFYFESDIYKENFDFIRRINNELFIIVENINKFFNEERYESLKAEFLIYSVNELTQYNEIYNKTLVDIFESARSLANGISDTDADFSYWFRLWHGGKCKTRYMYVGATNNINLVELNVSHIFEYMNNKTTKIINNFIFRIDEYLSQYINCTQILFNNLYLYIENKINNYNNIEKLLFNYTKIFNELLITNSNFGLFANLQNNYQLVGEININNLENNLNLFIDEFYKSYYLKSYYKFLEYPNEIIYKINQFKNEFSDNVNIMKQKINHIYYNRYINIIKTTNNFIRDLIDSHYKYIIIHVNNRDIMNEYLYSKSNYISNFFKTYYQQLSDIEDETLKSIDKENLIFTEENYNNPISKIYNKLELFIIDIENVINNNFIYQKCKDSSSNDNDLKNSFDYYDKNLADFNYNNSNCEFIKYKSNLSNYEYNYNVVKLRSGLFYTKKSLENIINIFQDLNYDDLLNIKSHNDIEHVLNDKKILDIYNSSINILKEINEKSNSLLNEQHKYFFKEILNIYSLNNDYFPFLKNFEKILNLESKSYNDYFCDYINAKFDFIEPLLEEFNNTLFKQKNEYILYYIDNNISYNTFKEIYENYREQIKNIFEFVKNGIMKLKDNKYFLNSFSNYLSYEQNKKRIYFKELINNISKSYNYHLLNITLNIGQIIENLLKKEYEEEEFSFRYEYIKIIDTYLDLFINNMTTYVTEIEINIQNKFKNIYDEFIEILYFDSIEKNYYDNLEANFTRCSNYSIELLDEFLIEDEINYKNYLINIYNSSLNTSEIEIFENKTEILLDCYKNNFYNYSIKVYKHFDERYKIKLNYIINKIKKIDINDISEALLYNYFKKNYKLDNYTQTSEVLDDIYYKLFLAYDDTILYINYTQNGIYLDYLYNLLIDSFKPSYAQYINNYLISPLIDNITIFINSHSEILLNYLISKIKDEYYYYTLLLDNVNELGKNTKESFLYLYDDIDKKLYYSIDYAINEYVLFFIDIFYKKNKYVFRDNFIEYYMNELNEFSIEIHQLKEIINELIYNGEFNKTLNKYSNELVSQLIINKINNTINELLLNKLYQAHSIINDLKINMSDILYNIEVNEDNKNINNIINNYKIILLNQNNQFTFKISDIPFEQLNSFIKNVLEPPLQEIKNHYNLIEEKILEKVLNITKEFPDFSEIIKEKIAIYDIIELIKVLIEKMKYLLLNYQKELNDDYYSYINKLIHYTYINGLDSYEESCNYSFCSINVTKNMEKTNNNISNISYISQIKYYNLKYISKNNKKYSNRKFKDYNKVNLEKKNQRRKIRNLLENENNYDETMGAISKEVVIDLLLDIGNTIDELKKAFINNFDRNAKLKTDIYIVKMNETYKVKLKNTILKSASIFSPILTRESYNILVDNMLEQYFKLENYLNNITLYLNNDIDKLIEILTNTSNYFGFIKDLSYNTIIGYFDILTEIIQDNYELITEQSYLRNMKEEYNEFEEIQENKMEKFKMKFGKIKEKSEKMLLEFIQKKIKVEDILKNVFDDIFNNKKIDFGFDIVEEALDASKIIYQSIISKKGYKKSKKIDLLDFEIPPFIFFFPTFPILQLRIIPKINIGLYYEMGFKIDLLQNDYNVFFDVSGNAEVSVSLEVGCYLPSPSSIFEISLSVGLKGTLGAGTIGMKISIFIIEQKYEIEFYYQYKAFSLSFYVMFKIKINLGIIKRSFSFYLMNKELVEGFKKKESLIKTFIMKKINKLF